MRNALTIMPAGTPFEFWDDETDYGRIYHVACEQPGASDDSSGTEDQPFATIGRAAAILQPGEMVIVHGGVYRECVRPACGGSGPGRMICYQAAEGERVVVKGSEVLAGPFRASEGWAPRRSAGSHDRVWMADLPADMLVGYNPFLANNMPAEYRTFVQDWRPAEAHRFQLRRGMVFANGRPLEQVFWWRDLTEQDGAFWVEDNGLRVHFRLHSDADPEQTELEITAREQVFAPSQHHLGYIRVSGFEFCHAADPVPIPQRALVSASRGHSWIIEDNDIHCANACGIDIGGESWHAERSRCSGQHIVRRNHIHNCGVSGIQGCGGVDDSLIEDNVIEHIGGRVPERLFECAGLKFHTTHGALIRGNVFRHIRDACGLWLDYENGNCRVTGNVFADIETLSAAVYLEVNHEPMLVDHNLVWDVRSTTIGNAEPGLSINGGLGISGDTGEHTIVAHNFLGRIPHNFAVSFNLMQWDRVVGGRTGLGRHCDALNNVFYNCPRRIVLGRLEDNRCDGNLYDAADDAVSFKLANPSPAARQNLAGWQRYFGLDEHSTQARIEADFDIEHGRLTWKIEGDLPGCGPVQVLHADDEQPPPGPFSRDDWRRSIGGTTGSMDMP